jgi:hypothetical protein
MASLILVLGVFSSISLIISALSTDRKKMVLFGMITGLLCAIQYSMNGSTLALIICCFGLVRSLLVLASLKHPVFNSWPFLAVFLAANTVAFLLSTNWDAFTIVQALPLIGSYLGTVAVFFNRMAVTKALMISCGLVWMVYQFSVGLYTQMIGESFTLCANIFALYMVLKAEKAGVSEEVLHDIDAQVIGAITGSIPVIKVKEALTGSIPVIKVTTDTKPLPVISKVSVTNISFPETGNLQQVPA